MGRKFHLQTGVTGPANAWSPLHYVPLRLACGNPSIPVRRFIHRANRALVFFAFFCLRRLEPTLAFAGCSLRFYLFQYPCAVLYAAQTALLLFSLSSVLVGYNRRWHLPGALSGFTCSSTRRSSIRRANRTLVFSAFFCLRRLEPTLAFAGCSLRFYLFQYPAQSIQKK